MIDVVRMGMKVRHIPTGRPGKVIAHVKADRHYIRVQFDNGIIEVFEGTRDLDRQARR